MPASNAQRVMGNWKHTYIPMWPAFLQPSCQFADQFESKEQNDNFQFLGFPDFLCNYKSTLGKEKFHFTKRAMMMISAPKPR